MLDKLIKEIHEYYTITNEEAKYIANYILKEYTTMDEEDIEYIMNNLYVYNSIDDAIYSETDNRSAFAVVKNMDYTISEEYIGKTMRQIWLENMDYHKVDIENSDIWFTIYE